MSEFTERLDRILGSTSRLEAFAEATQREVAELKHETRVRLNAHAGDLRSLKATRNKQRGAAKVLGVMGGALMAVIGWFRYG